MVSLLSYFLCSITIIPSMTVAAEAAWGGVHGGGGGWRGVVVTSLYDGWYGYPIRLARIYGYAPNYCYGYGSPYADVPYVHRHSYAAVRGVRRVRANRSAAAAASLGAATTRAPSSPSKTVQVASGSSASPGNVWTPMTVPISPSPANEPPKTDVDLTEWAKKFELKLNQSPDMGAASALLEQEGFRVDSGNKSATGWYLTAHDRNQRRGSIELQSDGSKIVLTVVSQDLGPLERRY